MARKLNTYVHAHAVDKDGNVQSQQFGPDDEVPSWARKAITNPDVWDGEDDEESEESAESAAVKQPPRKGPGSGGPAWVEFAASKGVTQKFDSKDDLIAELETRGLIEKE